MLPPSRLGPAPLPPSSASISRSRSSTSSSSESEVESVPDACITASTTRRVSSASSLLPTTDLSVLDILCCAALPLAHAALALASRAAVPGGGATR
eukprot:4150028-Prymnesium_polylepis.1